MTQEELAEVLGMSVSAVSLWESGKTMPDMGLVPAICSVLGVSADELFGIDAANKENEIWKIIEEASKFSGRGFLDEAIEILEKGLKRFPDSWFIMSQLMHNCFGKGTKWPRDKASRDRAVELGEKILEKCTDDEYRSSAVQILCFIYKYEDPERAEKLAAKMPDISVCRDVLLARVLKGERRREARWQLISTCLDEISRDMWVSTADDDLYTEDERAEVYKKCIALYRIIYENGDYGFYHTRLQDYEMNLTSHYAGNCDAEKTLEHLRSAADHAAEFVKFADCSEEGYKHTSLVMRGHKSGGFSTTNNKNNALVLAESLNDARYDFIRESDGFKQILSDLEKYAGKWDKMK